MCFPTIKELASALRDVNQYDLDPTDDPDDYGIDVRLRVHDGAWYLHSGDSSYDQDHRGYWGCASVPGNSRRFNSTDVARDLIEQARDQKAEDEIHDKYSE